MAKIVENILGNQFLKRGDIINFKYLRWKNDPNPCIIVTGVYFDRISGVNIHYLLFPIFRMLLNNWAGKKNFSYEAIKNHPIIRESFRYYLNTSVYNVKKVDWKALLNELTIIRNYTPQEMQNIRNAVEQQLAGRNIELLNDFFGKIAPPPINNI